MAARTEEVVLGNETVIAVDKVSSSESNTFTVIACATSLDWNSSIDTNDIVCYGGEKTLPSGRKPKAQATLNGIVKEYASASQATNVSIRDLYGWHKSKKRLKFAIQRPFEGDSVKTAWGYITQVGEQGSAEGAPMTWSATITFEDVFDDTSVSS